MHATGTDAGKKWNDEAFDERFAHGFGVETNFSGWASGPAIELNLYPGFFRLPAGSRPRRQDVDSDTDCSDCQHDNRYQESDVHTLISTMRRMMRIPERIKSPE